MPHNLTDGTTFTSPVPAPADGDDVDQAINDPCFQALADRTRFLLNRALGGVTSWPRTGVNIFVPLDHGRARYGDDWRFFEVDPFDSGVRRGWECHANSGLIALPLSTKLRTGWTLTGVAAHVRPGTGNTMVLDVRKQEHNVISASTPLTSSSLGTASSSSTPAQFIAVTGLTESIALGIFEYYVTIAAGSSSGTNFDRLYGLWFSFTDAGAI